MNKISKIAYPLYKRFYEDDAEMNETVNQRLRKALIPKSAEEFISEGLAYGTIVGLGLWIFATLTVFVLFKFGIVSNEPFIGVPVPNERWVEIIKMLRIPASVALGGIIFGSIGFVGTFKLYLFYPVMIGNSRKREINMLLPDALSYMYALSVGGLNQLQIFAAMAEADDTYGEVSKEFQVLLKETEYFETDYKTALQKHSENTPSKELSVFLSDMLSILSSGGDIESFLADQRRKFLRTAQQEQENTLETLELFGEMYMTLSMFPLLLIIVMVTMTLTGQGNTTMMYGVVYGLIPALGVGFLVLISTVKSDEIGDGVLNPDDVDVENESALQAGHLAQRYQEQGDYDLFEEIETTEQKNRIKYILKKPHLFFRENPLYTCIFTIPLALTITGLIIANGYAPTTLSGFTENVIWSSLAYFFIAFYIVAIPLGFFYEWNQKYRNSITNRLSQNLRKLANANDTGLTLLESIDNVAKSSKGRLSNEFEKIHRKVQYGMNVKRAFIEFNNKYRIPRLARTIKLVVKSQETSDEITDVLKTAAEVSETQDDIETERKSRARMQVAIIIMTYVTLLGVMIILQTQFVGVMANLASSGGGGGGGGGSGGGGGGFNLDINTKELSMLFFHAVALQALFSGFISGYIRDAKVLSGLKYSVVLVTISLVAWAVVV